MATEQTKDRRQQTLRGDAAGICRSRDGTADMPLRPDVALGLWMSWMETNSARPRTGPAPPSPGGR